MATDSQPPSPVAVLRLRSVMILAGVCLYLAVPGAPQPDVRPWTPAAITTISSSPEGVSEHAHDDEAASRRRAKSLSLVAQWPSSPQFACPFAGVVASVVDHSASTPVAPVAPHCVRGPPRASNL